jgi:hypothetical protein
MTGMACAHDDRMAPGMHRHAGLACLRGQLFGRHIIKRSGVLLLASEQRSAPRPPQITGSVQPMVACSSAADPPLVRIGSLAPASRLKVPARV